MVVVAVAVSSLILLLTCYCVSGKMLRLTIGMAYLCHLALAFVLLPHLEFLYPDVNTFHSMTEGLLAGEFPTYATGVEAFIGLQSIFYILFEHDYQVVTTFNSLFAVLLVIPIRQIARKLYSNLDLRLELLTVVVLFLPIPFLQLTLPLRDTLALLAFFTLLAVITRTTTDSWWWIPAIPLAGLAYLLRSELVLLLLVGVLVSGGIRFVQRNELPLGSILPFTAGVGGFGFYLFSRRFSFERLNAVLQARASGRAAYLESFSYSSWADVVFSAPLRATYFQYAPFPLHASSVFDIATVLMLPVLVLLTVAAYRSLTESRPNLTVLSLLGTIYLGGVVGYGLVDSNFGTTIRHRIPFVYLLVIFSAPVFARWERLLRARLDDWPDAGSSKNKQQREA